MPHSSVGTPRRVRVHDLSFSHADAPGAPLFDRVSVELGPGWTGVVGPNGAGKSTLLRLLSGELRPDGGWIEREPRAAVIASCDQRVDRAGDEVLGFALDWEPSARRWRARLGLDPSAVERWETLSPGERKRWQVGAALACEPDQLLLDEPSNHLDALARAALIDALRGFSGVGVLVSHDRALIDGLCSATLCVRPWRLFPGPYSAARAAWRAEDERQLARWDAASDAVDRAVVRLGQARVAHAGALASTSTSKRMKTPRDHDGSSSLRKGKAAMGERAQARGVARARALVEDAEGARDAIAVRRELGGGLKLEAAPCPRPRLLALQDATISVEGRDLLRGVDLCLERGGRLRIHGPNGSGKSTLLAHLLRSAELPAAAVMVLPQELSSERCRALLAEVLELPSAEQGHLMTILAALGVDPSRARESAEPSPGEARKLAIALGLARRVWLMVLDEPSNHLDLPSVERLEQVLAGWEGALLLVTHDEGLALALGCETLEIRDGRLERRAEPPPRDQGETGRLRVSA